MEVIKNEQELCEINGGVNFTSSIINALATGVRAILELGRSLGSAIRRGTTGNMC